MNRKKWMVCMFTGLLVSTVAFAQQEGALQAEDPQTEQLNVSVEQDQSTSKPLDEEMEQVKKDLQVNLDGIKLPEMIKNQIDHT